MVAEINPASWLHNAGSVHTAAQLRASVGSLSVGSSAELTARGGVNPSLGSRMAVTQVGAGTSMAVSVGSGIAHVPGSLVGTQGTYICINDAAVQLAIAAADGTNDRLDAVVATVRDSFYSGVNNDWVLQVVTGTPAAIPVLPTLPDNSLLLAEVLVQAAVTAITDADITDRRILSVGTGGLLPIRNEDERTALGGVYDGFGVWRMDLKEVQVFDGSVWRRIIGTERILFASSGDFVKADYDLFLDALVEGVGGGGGAGCCYNSSVGTSSAGSGGGSGAYARKIVAYAALGTSETITIGSGGAGAPGDNNTSNRFALPGQSTTFGSHLLAERGFGGAGMIDGSVGVPILPGIGGRAANSVGDETLSGNSGGTAIRIDGSDARAGDGGFGALGNGGVSEGGTGTPTLLPKWGGGGAGAVARNGTSAAAGQDGASGLVVVTLRYI